MIEYFTLEGMGLLRTIDDDVLKRSTIESVQGGKWVDDPGALKYFAGFGGDHLDPWPISKEEAAKQAASLGVAL